jgi:hypothetical protein
MLRLSQCRLQLLRALSPIDGGKSVSQCLIGSVGAVLGAGPLGGSCNNPGEDHARIAAAIPHLAVRMRAFSVIMIHE